MTSEPKPTPPMAATAGNLNELNLPVGPDGREWSHGLCNCSNVCGTFCLSFWCPCVTYSRNKHRFDHLNTRGTPNPEELAFCNTDCALHGLLTVWGASWVMQFMLRGNIRERYNIQGGAFKDCCTALWCTPCELTQESREIGLEEDSFGKGGE